MGIKSGIGIKIKNFLRVIVESGVDFCGVFYFVFSCGSRKVIIFFYWFFGGRSKIVFWGEWFLGWLRFEKCWIYVINFGLSWRGVNVIGIYVVIVRGKRLI